LPAQLSLALFPLGARRIGSQSEVRVGAGGLRVARVLSGRLCEEDQRGCGGAKDGGGKSHGLDRFDYRANAWPGGGCGITMIGRIINNLIIEKVIIVSEGFSRGGRTV